MKAYTVFLEQLPALYEAWASRMDVYVPVDVGKGFYDFEQWYKGTEIAWEYDVAYNSPKRFVFPPKENLIEFDRTTYTAKPILESKDQLIFGVHPYDIAAMNQLDQLLESGAPDQNYIRRRDKTVMFAMTPMRISDAAFWESLGCGKVDHGFDLYWTKIGPASFLVEVGSVRGEELLLATGPIPEATISDREAARRVKNRLHLTAKQQSGLKYPWQETPKIMAKSWDSPLWMHNAHHCLTCGSCVMVCPTCYCFDVKEQADVHLEKGIRYREWDGCMLAGFALVAGDHNFRPHTTERYRHRYFRKGKYIYDKIGELGCVGCGRCVRGCTSGIANPMSVFNDLWEAQQNES